MLESKPRACLEHPLCLATQPNTKTPSKCKSSTFRNTINIPVSRYRKRGTALYTTATLEWKPRACQDHPLYLATQPNPNTPSKCKSSIFRNRVETPILSGSFVTSSYTNKPQNHPHSGIQQTSRYSGADM